MSAWSRQHGKQWIADQAQAAHVPSFPLRELAEHLDSPQLRHRAFFRSLDVAGRTVRAPGLPFGLPFGSPQAGERFRGKPRFSSETSFPSRFPSVTSLPPVNGPLPLSGVRVLDFSWVIAGPTTTRYLAAMGAEVIKVEAPGKGDPGRSSGLHTVLGQGKQGIVLDLKKPQAVEIARLLAAKSDVLIENFATGVMDRLGLGAETLKALNPNLVYISASGMGRTGPDAHAVAYGTLLQCYAGFAGLNRHPRVAPRIGLAWLDPMCALMLAFVTAAALWHRSQTGEVARIDFSMLEAMLWTMAEPLLATQLGAPPQPVGNDSLRYAPHGAWQCAGNDEWIAIAVRSDAEWRALCAIVPGLTRRSTLDFDERLAAKSEMDTLLSRWAKEQSAHAAAAQLLKSGVPAAALARSGDLVKSSHLTARGFWDRHGSGVLPALPWQASFGRRTAPAPALGADTDRVLTEVLELPPERIAALRAGGAFG
jgi:crotonobetainyl-CoA:carnitine CoA-transferase CaiB-like acyl-CoA transferase